MVQDIKSVLIGLSCEEGDEGKPSHALRYGLPWRVSLPPMPRSMP